MKHYVSAVKVIWLSLSILILYFSLHRLSQLNSIRDVSELISIMSYGMILISLPTGLVFIAVLFFLSLVFNIIHVNVENKYFATIVIWFFFLLGGYIQWFYLMNKIVKKLTH
ncbi:hypothetical protein FNI85_22330 [Salmonella enterica subsp. salamae]|nr:hypothetical protein [Salmonella enterica subsp. salamae serovar Greenside]